MAQPKEYLYFLVNAIGQCFAVIAGVPVEISGKMFIQNGPDGWQEKSIKYQRNLQYGGGMWRTFTNPLKWVLDGALILRNIIYKKFTNSDVYLVIHRLDKRFGEGWVHKFFYRGRLDLPQTVDQNNFVEVNIMEDGLIKFFKANENTDYEIDINVPEAISIAYQGPRLKQKSSWIVSNGTLPNDNQPNIPRLDLFATEALESLGARSTERTVALNGDEILASQQYCLLIGDADTTIEWKWNFGLEFALSPGTSALPNPQYQLDIRAYKDGVEVYNDNLFVFGPTDPLLFYQHHTFAGTSTHTIPAGSQVYLRSTVTTLPAFTLFIYDEGGSVDAEYFYQHPTRLVKALRPAYVGQKLVDKMTGTTGIYTFDSSLLSDEWDNLTLTSGDGLRGIVDAKLTTNYSDFFNSYSTRLCCTTGIRGTKLYLEYLEVDYKSDIIMEMYEIIEVTLTPSKDYQFNRMKIGWPNTNTEDVNGRDEFNVTEYYEGPNSDVNKELDITGKYYASMYEALFCVINLEGKTTTDDDKDDRVFFLHVAKEPVDFLGVILYPLYRDETYTSVTGIIHPPTAYNLELSPKRCLYRWGVYLRAVWYGYEAGNLTFLRSDKNAELTTVKAGVTISEKANVVIGNLNAPVFLPWEITYTSPMPFELVNVMETGPNGTFKAVDGDIVLYGFPHTVSIQPATKAAQQTIMLMSPITDQSKLIQYGR